MENNNKIIRVNAEQVKKIQMALQAKKVDLATFYRQFDIVNLPDLTIEKYVIAMKDLDMYPLKETKDAK